MYSVILLLLLSIAAQAENVSVHYNNFRSNIIVSSDGVTYKDKNTDLTLTPKKCNSHIIERIVKEFKKMSRNLLVEIPKDHPMEIKIDGVAHKIEQRSEKGQYFHHFIEVMKQAKIEEGLNCK